MSIFFSKAPGQKQKSRSRGHVHQDHQILWGESFLFISSCKLEWKPVVYVCMWGRCPTDIGSSSNLDPFQWGQTCQLWPLRPDRRHPAVWRQSLRSSPWQLLLRRVLLQLSFQQQEPQGLCWQQVHIALQPVCQRRGARQLQETVPDKDHLWLVLQLHPHRACLEGGGAGDGDSRCGMNL